MGINKVELKGFTLFFFIENIQNGMEVNEKLIKESPNEISVY